MYCIFASDDEAAWVVSGFLLLGFHRKRMILKVMLHNPCILEKHREDGEWMMGTKALDVSHMTHCQGSGFSWVNS